MEALITSLILCAMLGTAYACLLVRVAFAEGQKSMLELACYVCDDIHWVMCAACGRLDYCINDMERDEEEEEDEYFCLECLQKVS